MRIVESRFKNNIIEVISREGLFEFGVHIKNKDDMGALSGVSLQKGVTNVVNLIMI